MKRRIGLPILSGCLGVLLAGLGCMVGTPAWAEPIYRCVSASGRPAYVANPTGLSNCQPVEVKVDEPSPEDVRRVQEEKRRKDEEVRINEEKTREERLIRAREAEAEAARRRARAAEDEVRLLKQRQADQYRQDNSPYWPYPIYIPQQPRMPHRHPDAPRPSSPPPARAPQPFGVPPQPPGNR
ncbi:hypothetical protein [Methylococcus sp. EFPC2]|uniref:hypothetical protein n=1 Tax=Methylococcus sp. EFPC2 TaxID=2812648 RepID=UPI0019673864|nr:hypothetical protein [Methylococcus sp. EFPC2]QSA97620.1 hypothetical protein JWZ97_01895 [Methylococcus sp. EFPC2]